ncbi:MAG: 30S ribosome-binding factor RbfA [Bacteroidales bacterium]|nr:30S ribosome-binding factor RbfA [Bacteroidales bacterium]
MDSTRQSKVSRLLQKEIANYFLHNSRDFQGAMISVSEVRVTSDLDEARIFVSIFPQDKRDSVFSDIELKTKEIRFEIAKLIRFQLRRIPNFIFMLDESLDYAERITQLLDKSKKTQTQLTEEK